jgi:hypothetical protein
MAIPPRPSPPGRSTLVADVPAPRQAHGSGRPTDTTEEPAVLAGLAWIVREVTHVPGILRLRHGRLSFESTRGVLFDATAAELGLELGRSFRAGMHVTVGTERLRVCVVRPPGGVDPCHDLVDRAVDRAENGYDDEAIAVTSGSSDAWTAWRPLLAPEPPAVARPRTRVRRAFTFAPS